MTVFGHIVFGVCSTSHIYRFMSFAEFGKFSAIVSLNGLSVPFCFASHYDEGLGLLSFSYRSLKLFIC